MPSDLSDTEYAALAELAGKDEYVRDVVQRVLREIVAKATKGKKA